MLQTRLKTVGLRRLAASALEQAGPQPGEDIAGRDRDEKAPAKNAPVDAFAYTEPGGRLELFTEPLMASEPAGIVREAMLTTSVDPKGTLLNRLRMLVNHGEARSLDLVMPRGLTLVRVRRDGADVDSDPVAGGPFHTPDGVGPGIEIEHDRRRLPGGQRRWSRMAIDCGRSCRESALPCLSFVWEVVTSSAWRAADCGPGLIATDREELFDWPYAALGLPTPSWNCSHAPAAAVQARRRSASSTTGSPIRSRPS